MINILCFNNKMKCKYKKSSKFDLNLKKLQTMKKTLQSIKKMGIYSAFFGVSLMSAQVTYTFTNASAVGKVGPTTPQITAAYLSTNLNGSVTVTGGIQSFTIPTTGPYRIEAYGASGGTTTISGYGAKISGDYNFTAGTVLSILVGQMGSMYATGNSDGGGGGTFVAQGGTLFAAAGGGGGAAQTSVLGQNANTSTTVVNGAASMFGSKAAGYNVNGTHFTYGVYSTVAQAFTNGGAGQAGGAAGGWPGGTYGDGGFGGGGSSCSCSTGGGGGGGGYLGGGGGGGSYTSGYGGSSYLNPLAVNQSSVVLSTYGNGKVIMTLLYGVNIAQTSTIACNGLSTAALSATVSGGTGPFTYSWSPTGGTAATATGLAAGTYTCLVSSSISGTTSSVFTVTQPSAVVSTVASQTNVTCYGGTNGVITLTTTGGTAPYSYTWSPSGGSAATATGLVANTYSCIVKDANNCSATSPSTTITQPATFSVATSNSIICTGETASLTATGATSYTWNTAATTSVIAVSPTVTTTYTITGVIGACTNSLTITQNVSACTGINEAVASSISIYPNPSNGIVNVTLTSELTKNSSIEVYDALGKLVVKQVLVNELNAINMSNLNNGIYTFKVINNTNTIKIGKFIKQ